MVNLSPTIREPKLAAVLETVFDPEIPVLSILDLGVVREAKSTENNRAAITITPTYSGCPAMDVMAEDIVAAFAKEGVSATVKLSLSPAWTSDRISAEGLKKLAEYGIAPPLGPTADKAALTGGKKVVPCPRCSSKNTRLLSQFGSTACKALFKCDDCEETFDYFKCLK